MEENNKMKKQSRSVMRTQNLLKTGLIELMQEKSVQQIEDELMEGFQEILDANPIMKTSTLPFPMLQGLFQLMKKNADFTRMVLESGHDTHFITELKKILKAKCFSDWISGDMHRSADEMATIATKFVLHGFQAMAAL